MWSHFGGSREMFKKLVAHDTAQRKHPQRTRFLMMRPGILVRLESFCHILICIVMLILRPDHAVGCRFNVKENVSSSVLLKASVARGIRSKLIEQRPNVEPILPLIMPKKGNVYLVKWCVARNLQQ